MTGRRTPRGHAAVALLVMLLAALAGPAGAVTGGREAPEAAASAVMVLTSSGGLCTGVVVAPDAVLTAGHCVAGVAENRIHYRDAAGAPVLLEVAARSVHPGYEPDAIRARARSVDLALLRARAPLPARFVPATMSGAMPRAGADLVLGGYGAVRLDDPRSTGRFRRVGLPVVEPYGPSRLLVWLRGRRAGGCQGDSGGPVSGADGVLALAAWVKDACGGLTQAVLLGPQRDWIDRSLAGWGATARWSGPAP